MGAAGRSTIFVLFIWPKLTLEKSLPDNSNHFTYERLLSQVVSDVLLLLDGFMVCWKRELLVWATCSQA